MYQKAEMKLVPELAEGVFMASGARADEENKICRFGRHGYNPNSDKCQVCSSKNGLTFQKKDVEGWKQAHGNEKGMYEFTFTRCVDNMPILPQNGKDK